MKPDLATLEAAALAAGDAYKAALAAIEPDAAFQRFLAADKAHRAAVLAYGEAAGFGQTIPCPACGNTKRRR